MAALAALAVLALGGEASAREVYAGSADSGVAHFPTPADTPVGSVSGASIDRAKYIAFTPDGAQGYVVQGGGGGGNAVALFDPATNAVNGADITSVGIEPRSIAITPDGTTAYVANGNQSSLTVIDTATNAITGSVPLGDINVGEPAFAWDLAISPDGSRLYVTTRAPARVTVVDTATNTVLDLDTNTVAIDRIVIPGGLPLTSGVAITPDGSELYVANAQGGFGGDTVGVIDTATNTVSGPPIAVGSGPEVLAITPDGSRVYVVNGFGSDVSVINTGDKSVEASTIPVGASPNGIAITPDGERAYVTDSNSGAGLLPDHVTAINLGTNTVSGSPITLGQSPQGGIAATPNQAPVAAFSATPAVAGSPTSFNAGTSTDAEGALAGARYDWDFGDGNLAPNAGPSPTHAYATPGNYNVTLTVTDGEGCSTDFVFTGHSAYCNGKATAAKTSMVTISPAAGARAGPTGRRAAALRKCKGKRGRARASCKKKAKQLPL